MKTELNFFQRKALREWSIVAVMFVVLALLLKGCMGAYVAHMSFPHS